MRFCIKSMYNKIQLHTIRCVCVGGVYPVLEVTWWSASKMAGGWPDQLGVHWGLLLLPAPCLGGNLQRVQRLDKLRWLVDVCALSLPVPSACRLHNLKFCTRVEGRGNRYICCSLFALFITPALWQQVFVVIKWDPFMFACARVTQWLLM